MLPRESWDRKIVPCVRDIDITVELELTENGGTHRIMVELAIFKVRAQIFILRQGSALPAESLHPKWTSTHTVHSPPSASTIAAPAAQSGLTPTL